MIAYLAQTHIGTAGSLLIQPGQVVPREEFADPIELDRLLGAHALLAVELPDGAAGLFPEHPGVMPADSGTRSTPWPTAAALVAAGFVPVVAAPVRARRPG